MTGEDSVWKPPESALSSREAGLGPPPYRRLAVTLAAPIIYFALTRVPIPTLAREDLDRLAAIPGYDPLTASLASLGLSPVISAFLVVEVLAIVVRPWAHLRTSGPDARRKLLRATYTLVVVFTLLQSGLVALNLQALAPGTPVASTAACVASITFCLVGLAALVDRFGLGGGYAVLIGATVLPTVQSLGRSLLESVQRNLLAPLYVGLVFVVLTGVAAITVVVLRLGRTRTPGLALRAPASGILPIGMATGLLTLPTIFSSFSDTPGALTGELHPGSLAYWGLLLLLTGFFGVLGGWLFNRPTLVGDAIARVTQADPDRAAEAARERLGAVTVVSVLFLVGLVAASGLLSRVVAGALTVDLLSAVLLTALVFDLIREWRFRRRFPDAVPAWPIHRVYAVAPALLALERAAIPAHPRAVRFRSLYQFFAPEVPIDLLVPSSRREEARAILQEVMPVLEED